MIKCHLSRIMGEKKVRIADVSKATGIHRNMITLLYYEKAKRIDFDVIEKICRYFNCTIGELLELQPDKTKGSVSKNVSEDSYKKDLRIKGLKG